MTDIVLYKLITGIVVAVLAWFCGQYCKFYDNNVVFLVSWYIFINRYCFGSHGVDKMNTIIAILFIDFFILTALYLQIYFLPL